jgi:hypothetical protein
MASDAYASGSWSFPNTEPTKRSAFDERSIPGAFEAEDFPEEADESSHEAGRDTNAAGAEPPRHRHYGPRTCRICLEVVLPTYEPASEALPGFLQPPPKVRYVSQEPESGRLIRPCKCKGSQRYVHEGCLQQWRHSDAAIGSRTYWECPTCRYRYRLERLKWSAWLSSTVTQIGLTLLILLTTIFVLGFVADPIINMYLDPVGTITTNPLTNPAMGVYDTDEGWTLSEHIMKGLASLGLLGAVKAIFAMGPWNWYNLRNTGLVGGGRARGGRGNNGRDRLENVGWGLILIGVTTFLWGVWKGVRAWSRKTLEQAGERVADVQGDDDDDIEEDDPTNRTTNSG